MADDARLDLAGLPLTVFPAPRHVPQAQGSSQVWHGGTYVSLGFAFGHRRKGGYPLVGTLESPEILARATRGLHLGR